MSTPIAIVRQAADKMGSVTALARALGIKHPALFRWRQVPAGRVLQIEKLTGISRHDMRPDIYPREDKGNLYGPETENHAGR
jgi:DNA-binding transcriptional regulator YdaS (Cro superfamily)